MEPFADSIPEHSDIVEVLTLSRFKDRLNRMTLFLFTLPLVISYTIFFVYPMITGIFYSFTNWDGFRKAYQLIGFENFIKIMGDQRIAHSLSFTLRYTFLLVILTLALSLVFALLLNSRLKMQGFFRSMYFFPAVISLITVGLIFNQIFYQVIPSVGKFLGITVLSTNIMANSSLAPYGILFVNLWQGVAIPTVLLLAALQSVPHELMESAAIDGATGFRRFLNVQVPFLIPVINIILILSLRNGLTLFDYVQAMTGGGPARSTESIGILIYNYAFKEMNFSYGTTVSVVLFLIIGVISLLQMKILNRFEVK